jgi:hypothetical protein
MSRKDTEVLVQEIYTKNYAPRTIADHPTAIKTLWKWLEGAPRRAARRRRRGSNRGEAKGNKFPEQLLTRDHVKRLVKAAVNPRDKALVTGLYESGWIGEILNQEQKCWIRCRLQSHDCKRENRLSSSWKKRMESSPSKRLTPSLKQEKLYPSPELSEDFLG